MPRPREADPDNAFSSVYYGSSIIETQVGKQITICLDTRVVTWSCLKCVIWFEKKTTEDDTDHNICNNLLFSD